MLSRGLALAFSAIVLTGGPATAHEFKAGTITVSHPWARATPPNAKVAAAYFTAEASRLAGDRLLSAKTDIAGRAELHNHINEGGVMKMRPVESVIVSAGNKVTFKPSGYHVMLMELKQPLKEGDILPLTLVFEKAGEIKVEATIEAIGATGPHGLEAGPKAAKAHSH